jgi:competence protein ComEA
MPADRSRPLPRTAVLTGGLAIVLAILAFVLAFGSGPSGTVAVDGGALLASSSSSPDPRGTVASGRILVVEIVGAVERPGVFRLPAGARVGDLVAAAGGYGPRVDTGRAARDLNLAAALHDGDQIRVPARDDPAAATSRPTAGGRANGAPAAPIDLNRATAAELDSLPGIGPVTAAKIIASREEQPFRAVADLRTRKLIGDKTFAQLKDLVTVS